MRWALLLAGLALVGCETTSSKCEDVCELFVTDCGFAAWPTVTACRQGCVEDLYRRDDVDEVLACYRAAVAPPTQADAEARVDDAISEGLFDRPIAAGTFDRDAAVTQAVEWGTCDAFEVVQCKVDAITKRPELSLINDY
jgi:hypothetical protein